MLHGELSTVYSWKVRPGPKPKPTSLANFPMQANGSEMLRLACIFATESGIRVCAPIHDALLVEGPIERIEEIVKVYRERGWNVITNDEAEAFLRKDLPLGHYKAGSINYKKLVRMMKELELGGVLHIYAGQGSGEPYERVIHALLTAEPSNGQNDNWEISTSSSSSSSNH